MIKLDQNYSDYTDETDEAYPAGKAVNASNSESYDGTPILADMINDMHGARQAIFKEAYGSVDGMSGEPDNVHASDTLNAIKKLIDDPDEEHAALRGVEAHGATSEAFPGQIVTRDEYGRAKISDPLEEDDVSTKKYVDDNISDINEELEKRERVYVSTDGVNVLYYALRSWGFDPKERIYKVVVEGFGNKVVHTYAKYIFWFQHEITYSAWEVYKNNIGNMGANETGSISIPSTVTGEEILYKITFID